MKYQYSCPPLTKLPWLLVLKIVSKINTYSKSEIQYCVLDLSYFAFHPQLHCIVIKTLQLVFQEATRLALCLQLPYRKILSFGFLPSLQGKNNEADFRVRSQHLNEAAGTNLRRMCLIPLWHHNGKLFPLRHVLGIVKTCAQRDQLKAHFIAFINSV